ncbi:MAG: DUF4178 domain-containing protein [Kofleriaceae bacterium]
MIWILLVVLTVVGAVSAVGIAVNDRRKALRAGNKDPLALPAGDSLVERGVRDLRVNDILTIDHKDYLVEGLIAYDEDGHRWSAGRVVDGSDVRWILIGIERVGGASMRLLQQDDSQSLAGYPPEAHVIGEVRYVLDKRGAATCRLEGDVGPLGDLKKDRPSGHVERCRWWLYSAPGEDTLLVEQWGSDYRVLRGKKVGEGTVELMPAS